jgi:phosphoribosyl-ATP pyrophosphohydrolase
MTNHIIDELFETIKSRKGANPESSYVASLYSKGTEKIAEKVGEEAIETIIEAIKGDKEKLASESADLLFHLMVLWADQGLEPSDIMDVLQSRLGISGHDEKASRS